MLLMQDGQFIGNSNQRVNYTIGRSHVDVELVPIIKILLIISTSTKHIMRNHVVRIFNYYVSITIVKLTTTHKENVHIQEDM
jgi:hypothetical protein